MNSIRVRVALMLVGSVLSVVVLSTLVMFQTVGNLVEQSSSEALAHRVAMMMPAHRPAPLAPLTTPPEQPALH